MASRPGALWERRPQCTRTGRRRTEVVQMKLRAMCYVALGKFQESVNDMETFLKISKSPEAKENAKKVLEMLKAEL